MPRWQHAARGERDDGELAAAQEWAGDDEHVGAVLAHGGEGCAVSRFDADAGRSDGEEPAARPRAQSGPANAQDAGRRDVPVLLGATERDSSHTHAPPVHAVGRNPPPAEPSWTATAARVRRPIPRDWPAKPTRALWEATARSRPPVTIMVGGAEGGVGVSVVTALVGELYAAASPGPTVIADQCGMAWNTLVRRLLGEPGGMPAAQVGDMFERGATGGQIAGIAPRTSAGAALVDDSRGFTSLHNVVRLVDTANGTLVVDAGRVDRVFAVRLDVRSVAVIVGRADMKGAEAVCASLELLRKNWQTVPIVVLSSVTSSSAALRRRVHAASRLVAAAGVSHLVHLPHDVGLASGQPFRLDQVAKSTAIAGLRLASQIGHRIGHLQGENVAHRRRSSTGLASGQPPAGRDPTRGGPVGAATTQPGTTARRA